MNEPATVNIGVKNIAKYMPHITKFSDQERLKVRTKAIIKKIISTAANEVIISTTLLLFLIFINYF